MDESETDDQFAAFTGDRAAGSALRSHLATIARDFAGSPIGELADEVLAGRRPIRDLGTDPQFGVLLTEGMNAYREYLDTLTPEERRATVAQGRADDQSRDD
ncbi:MAG: hypothetical protein ACI379_15035 [Nocardioides sp.]|uniref:hypothetical protein n=1 Tax=Nocardioides sp. TaxID=35761 RepID=UPI003F01D35B